MTLTARLSHLWPRAAGPTTTTPRHLWATVVATTVDGVTAHVQVEFTREVAHREAQPEVLDAMAMDTVETALRHYVGTLRAATLPVAGESLTWVERHLAPHDVIGNVFVVISDVEVNHELSRG